MRVLLSVAMLSIAGLVLSGRPTKLAGPPATNGHIAGRVLGANAPIARSTVTLWAAGAGAPTQLAQAQTGVDGTFKLLVDPARPQGSVLYLVAKGGQPMARAAAGDNPAIGLLAVLGTEAPEKLTIDEFSTVASVWTSAQFLDGEAMRGNALGLRIAAGNVSHFVDVEGGGYGGTIQNVLNSGQSPTMANFATLADVVSGCVVRVTDDACTKLFAAATSPRGEAPTSTLTAAQSIARYPWYKPDRVFALLNDFYPMQKGKIMRDTPFNPYLSRAPSAWVLPLKFSGGGYRAGGKAMFDSQGNLWVGDNFTVGWQGGDNLWQGHATKFAPDGRPLSPITTGFAGGGMAGGTFGAAVDAHDNAWFTSYGGKSITVFDNTGKPLTPPEGITFDGQLGLMQGVIVTPSSDVWVVGVSKNQVVYFPKGDYTKGKLLCEGFKGDPCHALMLPFHLGIDQQNRIWVTNGGSDIVTRFDAANPASIQTFKTGYSGSGLGIDSKGNVWVMNRLGNSARGKAVFDSMLKVAKSGGNFDEVLAHAMSKQQGGPDGGSVSLLRPDGTPYPGSSFTGGALPGPWAVVVDGNDNVWISNFAGPQSPIAHLCGVRTETCPPGMKTGDQISPPGGYVGGGLQMQTDLAIDPAGNVWVMNNWQDINSCFGTPPEAVSTLCGGDGVVVFYGMAKPVHAPQIGPARAP